MKTALIALAAAGLVAGGTILLAQTKTPAEDRAVADQVVSEMTAEELSDTPAATEPAGPPDLTPEVTRAILEDLRDIEGNGGLLKIARAHGASMAQVKIVIQARDARLREIAGEVHDHEVVVP